MKNYHILEVKHIPQTDFSPARVKIKSPRFKTSVLVSYNNEVASNNPCLETAEKWLLSKNFDIVGMGEGSIGYYIITNTFEPIKK